MFEIFREFPKLLVAFSEKSDGNLKAGVDGQDHLSVQGEDFFARRGVNARDVVANGLVQGDSVQVVGKEEAGLVVLGIDASMTKERGVFLSVTAADCLPVFFFDPQKEVVAVAHAGWRGLAKGILPKVVEQMTLAFQCSPQDIRVGIGPGIGECHYDVKEDVVEQFRDFAGVVNEREGKMFLDLKKVATLQLQASGVPLPKIEVYPACTYCAKHTYFSWRRDRPERVQAMLALIGMRG